MPWEECITSIGEIINFIDYWKYKTNIYYMEQGLYPDFTLKDLKILGEDNLLLEPLKTSSTWEKIQLMYDTFLIGPKN